MYLNLLDINKFIESNKVMEVKTFRIPSKKYDSDGLWSEIIFGPIGSKSRSEKFGYINLKTNCIHPLVFDILTTVSEETSKIVREKETYIVENKKYIPNTQGETGVAFLIKTFKDVDFSLFCHRHKKNEAKFLNKNKELILINKFLVQPAAFRDIDIYIQSKKIINDEINDLYSKLIIYIMQLTDIEEIDNLTIKKIQLQLNIITDYIKKRKMTGKRGLFKGTMLKKTLDYTSRLVLSNSPHINLGEIGLPWHTLVAIYEPFIINKLFKHNENQEILLLLKIFMNTDHFDPVVFSKFIKELIKNPDIVPLEIKNGLIEILNQFLSDQVVLCKRDPVQQRNSWFAAKPIITEGRVAYLNSLDLGPIGGDCVKGNVITYNKLNNEYIQQIESIDDFYKNHNVELINQKFDEKTGIEVYDFIVKDDVYSIGVNENTGQFQYSKIQKWSIHNNIKLINMNINNKNIVISENNSCFAYNIKCKEFQKLNVNDVINNQNDLLFINPSNLKYKTYDLKTLFPFIKLADIYDNELDSKNSIHKFKKDKTTTKFIPYNLFKNENMNAIDRTLIEYQNSNNLNLIPAKNVKFIPYTNLNKVELNINNLTIISQEDKIAYDFTMEDESVRSFLHASMIIQCNSDGDTVAIYPIFTNEAKEEVKNKLDPTISSTKWKNITSYNDIIYSPSLDSIATIYSATSA